MNDNPWYVAPPEGAKFSNRRRALAEWILDRERGAGNLAARVIANRLWQHHFGQGIVTSPTILVRPAHCQRIQNCSII